jgi:hypothetical protein
MTAAAASGLTFDTGLVVGFVLFMSFFFGFGGVLVAIALSSPWVNAGRQKSSASITRLLGV